MSKLHDLIEEVMEEGVVNLGNAAANPDLDKTDEQAALNALLHYGFRGTIDPKTLIGTVNYKGTKIKFSLGEENMYFDLPGMHTKDAMEKTVQSLKVFLDFVLNHQ